VERLRQPAGIAIVHLQDAQNTFDVVGRALSRTLTREWTPASALINVLLPGYDFTRNQVGGSEMTDFASPRPRPVPTVNRHRESIKCSDS